MACTLAAIPFFRWVRVETRLVKQREGSPVFASTVKRKRDVKKDVWMRMCGGPSERITTSNNDKFANRTRDES